MEIVTWILIAVAVLAVVSLAVAVLTGPRLTDVRERDRPSAESDQRTEGGPPEDDLLEDEATG
jgi:hypothetical protein